MKSVVSRGQFVRVLLVDSENALLQVPFEALVKQVFEHKIVVSEIASRDGYASITRNTDEAGEVEYLHEYTSPSGKEWRTKVLELRDLAGNDILVDSFIVAK